MYICHLTVRYETSNDTSTIQVTVTVVLLIKLPYITILYRDLTIYMQDMKFSPFGTTFPQLALKPQLGATGRLHRL